MGKVLCAIENGHSTLVAIQIETKLREGQVSAAIANLAYTGAIKTGKRGNDGKAYYQTTAVVLTGFPPCFRGARSVFEPMG